MGLVVRGIFVRCPSLLSSCRCGVGGNADAGVEIGRPSDVIYPPRTNPDCTRRRSSVFSISPGTSPDGKRTSLMELFKRKGSVSEAPAESTVQFNEVDMGKKTETE